MAYSGMNDPLARLLMARELGLPSAMNNPVQGPRAPSTIGPIPQGPTRMQQALAAQLMSQAGDTSPVGHWTQALARIVQGGIGGHLTKKQGEQTATREQAMAEALSASAGGDREAAMSLLPADPQLGAVAIGLSRDPQHEAPKTREVKVGSELVTQEFNQASGKWDEVGRASLTATTEDGRTREMKNYEFRQGLKTPEEKAIFDAGVRAAQVVDLGGVPNALRPEGPVALSTPGAENAATAAKSAAQASGTAQVDAATKAKEKATAFNVYEQALTGLKGGLAGASTGPVVGRLPAVTANQQKAQGGVAAMLPALKGIFRSAGEGTFTDKDQEMLEGMIPTRQDLPEVRDFKLKTIDDIVRAKLGQDASAGKQDDPLGIR